jgi:hypothetical protein
VARRNLTCGAACQEALARMAAEGYAIGASAADIQSRMEALYPRVAPWRIGEVLLPIWERLQAGQQQGGQPTPDVPIEAARTRTGDTHGAEYLYYLHLQSPGSAPGDWTTLRVPSDTALTWGDLLALLDEDRPYATPTPVPGQEDQPPAADWNIVVDLLVTRQ